MAERADVVDRVECEVTGAVPPELRGAFYRLGGQWHYPPKFADDIPLHADGFISMFRIAQGGISYRARYVETDRLRANRATGRTRFGYYRNRVTDDSDVAAINASVANTSAFAFAGRLFALKEDTLPYEIDPITLETRGTCNFGGAFQSPHFTAHPKIDGLTGELVTFGYQAAGPFSDDVLIAIFAPDGSLRHEIRVALPWLDMVHDFAITRDHILLPMGGYTVDRDALAKGGPLWRWAPDLPARIGVLRRDGDGSDLRWFTGPKGCLLHVFNAYDEDGRITLDAPFYQGNPFPFLPSIDGSPWRPEFGQAYVRRLTFDLAADDDRWREEILFDMVIGDLGDVDSRRTGHRHRFIYGMAESPRAPGEAAVDFRRPPWPMANSYVRFDVAARRTEALRLPYHHMLGECVFVPRQADAAEGDGFLIGVADDLAGATSQLVIADAANLSAGPIATARMPVRAGPQVHGCWVREGELPLP